MWKLIFAILVFIAVGWSVSLFDWGRMSVFQINSYSVTVAFLAACGFTLFFLSRAQFGKSKR